MWWKRKRRALASSTPTERIRVEWRVWCETQHTVRELRQAGVNSARLEHTSFVAHGFPPGWVQVGTFTYLPRLKPGASRP